ncbi:MAG: 2,3-bisphosphoglycerate-independent phosphoglycerate mutase [Sandaracinaceae bacterium]|nr:2,3-bisphosphoglycerate-independent phosphoglycerate mutase [Sandaracinaceae bacterium]
MSSELKSHPIFRGIEGPILTVVMDGIGIGRGDESDAVSLARTVHLDRLRERSLYRTLNAHGVYVGLPSNDDMGNSEVGHNALGAGRIFDQGAKRVALAIESGEIFEGETFRELIANVKESREPLHLIGLLSDGNVHSHIDHLFALLKHANKEGVERVRVHILLDGRDVPEVSALDYVEPLERLLGEISSASARDYRIASGGGRMIITMDRYEADWAMVERGYRHHVHGEGRQFRSATEAIQTLRDENPGVIDQNLPPFVIADEAGPVGPIRDGASVIFFNFRGDRAIEISRAFEEDDFSAFDRGRRPQVLYAGMMEYDGDLHIPSRYLVDPPAIDRTLGEYLARSGITQFACSETQKYGHVTYFWNGNRSGYFDRALERYVEIPSDLAPFEERPWMKAAEITDATVESLLSGREKVLRINYANGDMVGHTGNFNAAVLAVEAVDLCIGRLIPIIEKLKGALIITADHGNADEMFERSKRGEILRDANGRPRPKTSHTLNAVPFYLYAPSAPELALRTDLEEAGLANIAATVMELVGKTPPEDYLPSLLRFGD